MINFFRKIRKKLADDNKFFKYWRYAIGEILLVVIGILLALQINNWNEERKIKSAEQIILKDLKVEITSNIKHLENVTKLNRISLSSAEILVQYYKYPEKLAQVPDSSLRSLMFKLPGIVFQAEKGILNSIISSGQINTIKNKKLKYILASLIDVTEGKMGYTNWVHTNGNEYLERIIYPKSLGAVIIDGKTIWGNIKDMYKIPEFFLAVRGNYNNRRRESIRNEEELKKIYEEVITLINSEIDSE